MNASPQTQRPSEPWRQRAAERRQRQSRTRILTAARELFTQSGYTAVSVEQIARVAGVAPATVYNRFGSKASLAAWLFSHALEQLQREVEKGIASGAALEDMVRRHFERLGKVGTRQMPMVEALWRAVNEYALAPARPLSGVDPRRIAPVPRPLTTILESAQARRRVPTGVSLPQAAAMMTNAFLIRLMNGDDPTTAARETTELLLYGICGKAARADQEVKPRRLRRK